VTGSTILSVNAQSGNLSHPLNVTIILQ